MARYIDPMVLDQAATNTGAANDEQLAKMLGTSSQTVRNLRNRQTSPSLENLARIAKAAGVPWEQAIITVADSKKQPAA